MLKRPQLLLPPSPDDRRCSCARPSPPLRPPRRRPLPAMSTARPHRRRTCLASLLFLLALFFLHLVPLAVLADDESPSKTEKPNLRAKSLILVKIYCLIIVFFATFVGGVSPYFYAWNQTFLVLGTQFAGGVFLGTAMMHFLSDSTSGFESLTTKDYPFSYMLACAGYLLTYLGDVVIQHIIAGKAGSNHQPDVEMAANNKGAVRPLPQDTEHAAGEGHTDHDGQHTKNVLAATLVTKSSFGDTLLLILALCFHSVFEGIAIGVSKDAGDAWKALWTISLHKVFAAIAMGIALLRLIPDRPLLQTVLYSFAFGISSPIGIVIGIVIDATAEGPVADWIYAISMGIACGVFVYVAINHLFAKGYTPTTKLRVDTPIYRFLAVTLGVAILAVVMTWDT